MSSEIELLKVDEISENPEFCRNFGGSTGEQPQNPGHFGNFDVKEKSQNYATSKSIAMASIFGLHTLYNNSNAEKYSKF